MSFNDMYRMSVHAAIFNEKTEVLQVKANYGEHRWGLPGGAINPGETFDETLIRECQEELDCEIEIVHLTGVYYHAYFNSHVFICRCLLKDGATIKLSDEHSDYRYFALEDLSKVQKQRIDDCLNYNGVVKSAKF